VACACGKGSNVEYKVTFKDNTVQVFPSVALAQAALRQAGGGMMKAVPVAA
jgi:hypothetical protein